LKANQFVADQLEGCSTAFDLQLQNICDRSCLVPILSVRLCQWKR